MPIEFRCTQCGKLLRTGDDSAGKQAKCPQCGLVLPVPGGAAAPNPFAPSPGLPPPGAPSLPAGPSGNAQNPFGFAGGSTSAPAARPDFTNPYQAPSAYGAAPAAFGHVPGQWTPTIIEFGDVFNRAWEIFKGQMGICIGVVVVANIMNYAAQFASQLIMAGVQAATPEVAIFVAAQIVVSLVLFAFQFWVNLGSMVFMLRVARGEPGQFGDLFSGGRYFLKAFVAAILLALMMAAILAVAMTPGGVIALLTKEPGWLVLGVIAIPALVVVGLMFSQYQQIIIDRNAGIIESLQLSKLITSGNKGTLFLLSLSFALINVGGLLACCIGLLFTLPFSFLAMAVAYTSMTGQTATYGYSAPPQPMATSPFS